MFQYTDLKRIILSSIGALLLSTTCVIAAVGPVQATDGRSATALRY